MLYLKFNSESNSDIISIYSSIEWWNEFPVCGEPWNEPKCVAAVLKIDSTVIWYDFVLNCPFKLSNLVNFLYFFFRPHGWKNKKKLGDQICGNKFAGMRSDQKALILFRFVFSSVSRASPLFIFVGIVLWFYRSHMFAILFIWWHWH